MPEFQSFWHFAGWFAIITVVSVSFANWRPINTQVRVGDDKFES